MYMAAVIMQPVSDMQGWNASVSYPLGLSPIPSHFILDMDEVDQSAVLRINLTLETDSNITDNVTVPVDLDHCLYFHFVHYTFLLGIPALLGLFGNTLSWIVLHRDRGNAAALFLLKALAVADNAVCFMGFVLLAITYGALWVHGIRTGHAYMLKYTNPLGNMAVTGAVWCTALLAVNRYVAVCKPLHAARIYTLKSVRIQVFLVFLFSVAVNVPRFFQYNIIYKENSSKPGYEVSELGKSHSFHVIYKHVIYNLLALFLPMICLIVINCKVIFHLRKSGLQRTALTRSVAQSQEENITFVMVIIIVIFIICNLPDRLVQVFKFVHLHVKNNTMECPAPIYYAQAVTNMLVIINSASNFLVYYFLRKRFRRNLFKLLCPCWSRDNRDPGVKRLSNVTQVCLLSVAENMSTNEKKRNTCNGKRMDRNNTKIRQS